MLAELALDLSRILFMTGMPKNDVPSSEKMHTVNIETECGKVDRRGVVLGSIQHQRRKACKTSPSGGDFGEDPLTLKLVDGLREESDKISRLQAVCIPGGILTYLYL